MRCGAVRAVVVLNIFVVVYCNFTLIVSSLITHSVIIICLQGLLMSKLIDVAVYEPFGKGKCLIRIEYPQEKNKHELKTNIVSLCYKV